MDAPVLENSVQSFIENSAKDKVLVISNITTDLVNGQLQLVTFIEKLQNYLTNTDVTIRTRCVRLIGEVLHQIPNTQLSRNEVELLVTYLCERLTDHHSIQPPALYALLALSGCKNFPNGLASKICRVVFQNVQNQSLSQPDRCSVYTILSNFLDTKMEELQKMEGDFVLGFIQVMDTEKDPRNLMICFQCARTIILNFSLGVFVEEMFEVTSCYFPIDFTPPPSDNTKMTREDLIKGLRGCLSATEKFGEYAYPLILEKLTSDIQSAKLDCLQTLIECVEVYGIKQLREFQSSLYNCIKNEVFSSGNPVMEQLALDTLRTIVRTLSKTKLEGPDSPVYAYVAEILQDCKRYLTDEDTRLLVPVCRLLISCAQGADSSCCQILKDVLQHLINLYNKSSVNSQRKTVLEMMSRFVRVVSGYREGQCHQMLLSYIDELSTLIEGALIDSSSHLRLTGVAGVNEMIKVSTPHTQKYTELVLDKVFSDKDKDVRISCLEPLETVARVNSPVLESTVIPHILRKLKTEPMDEVISEVLSTVTVTYNVVTMVTPELFLPLHSIASALPNEQNEEQAKNIVICLLTIIQKNCHDSQSLQYLCDTVIKSIYKLVITSSMYPVSVLQQRDVLDRLSMCVRCIATRCNNSQLQDLYLETTELFLHGDLSVLSISDGTFKPFEVSSPWQQTQVISMVTAVICTCNEKIQDEDLYVQKLLCLCERSQHNYTQLEACKCLAGLLNKQPDILQKLDTSGLEQTIQGQPLESRRLSLQLLIWLTKALVMRGHQKSKSLVMFLMTMLSDSDIGLEAATGFNTILTDSPDVLNKSMNAVIRMMYKQRLFVENVSHLVKNFESTSHDTKKNYLRVLSSMLKTLPKQVLLTELPPLFPLMIHSLLSDDLELQMSTMDTLYDLTHDAPEIVSKHVDSMIPQLLKLSVTKSSMKLRQSALQCIGVVTVLPVYIIQPYKAQVIKGLEKCLDDNKRLVRKEAVLARNECNLPVIALGFANGPPFSSCLTLFPKHGGLEAQTTDPPYTVTVDENNYSPGQKIHITIRGNDEKQFKGVQITVHRSQGDIEELIGTFTEFPVDKLKVLNCIDGQENVIVHKNNAIVTEVNIRWTAPAVNEGNLTFHTSIVEKYDVFWINILNVLPSKIDVPVVPALEVQNAEDVIIDYDKCGESMGCVLYPYYCTGENCDAGATFSEDGNQTRFQLFAKNTEGYISIGLSDDRLMGDDHTITCTLSDDEYSVQHGYNPGFFNYRQYKKNEIQDMTVSMRDGKLYCEFTRPRLMSVVNMFNPTKRLEFDISNDYYVMIAWGYAHKGSTAVTHHIELPFITNSKVNFKSTDIYRGSALPTLTQVHGLLMMMSWVLFTGLATIIARYFKRSFGEKKVCGVKVWFQSHRASAVLAAVITATSFIIIYVKVDGFTEVAETHAFVGIALMSATTLQVIGGPMRPDPKSDFRKIFNWGHWFTGKAAHILAAVSVFLAFNIKLIPKTQSLFGVTISIIWVVCQVLWEVFFEIRHRRRQSSETKETVHLQKADIVLLFIYLINMLCVFAVIVMAIYFF